MTTLSAQQPPRPSMKPTGSPASSAWRRLSQIQALPILAATILLFVVSRIAAPGSLSKASLVATVAPAAVLAVAAIGQTLVIQQRGIDLSAAASISLSGVIYTRVVSGAGLPPLLALLVVLVAAALIGLLNGVIVTRLHITPIVATLASNSVLYGIVWTLTQGANLTPPGGLVNMMTTPVGPFPSMVAIAVVLVVVSAVWMSNSSVGKRFTGVGASPRAARAAGVNVDRYIVSAYVASGVSAALAGLLLVGYVADVSPNLGDADQLAVIAAVVVGGAALAGGRGSIVATAIACLFLQEIFQLVLTLGAPTSIQLLVQAAALAMAAAFRLLRIRRSRAAAVGAGLPDRASEVYMDRSWGRLR